MSVESKPEIVESFLEHKANLALPAVESWTVPNPFIAAVFPMVQPHGASLTDFAFNADAKSVGDSFLQVRVQSLGLLIKIFIDHVEFRLSNPDWGMSETIIPLFEQMITSFGNLTRQSISEQEITLAFHVVHGGLAVEANIASLLNVKKLGSADSYGVSVTTGEGFFAIEKSVRYTNASFVRLSRKLSGKLSFSEVAAELYREEVRVLELIGIRGVD